MAIISLSKEHFETISLELHPTRSFSSSSLPALTGSVTGSVYVFAERSPFFKETFKLGAFNDSEVDANSLDDYRNTIFMSASFSSSVSASFEEYLSRVTSTMSSSRQEKYVEVLRFEPTNTFTSDTLRKNIIRKVLFESYRTECPALTWGFSNYNSINFFTASTIPSSSCLVYPGTTNTTTQTGNLYNPKEGFTFAFYLNPRRTIQREGDEYKAGTILHMSSAYALSLVTGSSVGVNGLPDSFRLLLQLSESADYAPSTLSLSTLGSTGYNKPKDLIFLSDDNSLKLNKWHHVAVAWSPIHNNKTGSFYINTVEEKASRFGVMSSSINDTDFGNLNPLFIGNFYDGYKGSADGIFNSNVATTEGVYAGGGNPESDVSGSYLQHPLNAEIHDVRIYDKYLSLGEILTASMQGPEETLDDLLFYLPPFFVRESPKRNVLKTPFQATNRTTDTPFNVELSFGVRGRDVNLQNYMREFVNANHPRLYYLTSSTINESTGEYTANQFLWESSSFSGQIRARNLLLLPNDNGNFAPNFNLLNSGTISTVPASGSAMSSFVNDYNRLFISNITLNNMIPTSSILKGLVQSNPDGTDSTATGGILQSIVGTSPESPGVSPGGGYTILQRTRDNSSNEVVIFDASNLFYGMKINPGTITIRDPYLTASDKRISMTIKDDGMGNLYRANALSPHATWARVGNVLYDEGIMTITSPNIPFFGKDQFDIEFEGWQNIHTLEINIPAPPGKISSSSNPSYNPEMIPNNYASDKETDFSVISGLLFHDDNMNIITRTNLAQPVVKRQGEKFMFRIKIDF